MSKGMNKGMKLIRVFAASFALSFLFAGAQAQAATVSGTVTDKTTGKPAAGDAVVLVEPMSGMSEVGHTTTDARGHYSLNLPSSVPYLVRATHQGADYFIPAPQGGGTGDIPVYDVAAKVQGVTIDSDILEVEAQNGALNVDERFFVHNTSSPALTQFSARSFEIVLPPDAVLGDVEGQRPGGLPTNLKLVPEEQKGHYAFNFPIQPDEGDKDTLLQVIYTLPYTSGKYEFHAQPTLAADNFAVLMPMSMKLTGGAGANFRSVQADPGIQTLLMKGVEAGKTISFTLSGTGSMPREDQNAQSDNGQSGAAQSGPGGGLAPPINTPDPLSKYKWWILGGLALLLTAIAAFLLRKPATAGVGAPVGAAAAYAAPTSAAAKNTALLNVLKEELFALESERIAGTLPQAEYAEQKAALETVLKRALKRQ